MKYPIATLSIALLPLVSNADTLLSFGTDMVTADASFSRDAIYSSAGTGLNNYTDTLTFSDVDVLSPDPATTTYTGQKFYGGYDFSSSTKNGSISGQRIRNNLDRIFFQAYSGDNFTGSTLSAHTLYLFKQEDFATGHQSGSNNITSLSVKSNSYGDGALTARFLVQIGGTYYLSNTTATMGYSNTFEISESTLLLETWAEYTPYDSLDFDQGTAIFATLDLNNVTAVGLYAENDAYSDGTSTTAFALGITNFEVQGTTVPEPSSYALLLSLMTVGLTCSRRTIKRNR
ncbi:hypothetical protein QEH52_19025 [Coraliomargarita sp. SDUM461003]|uniref:PEP-CTERM protein-sorting domain-containing protein n=1 Tax=Thalassobacterium maritimum TaxID=3041265 RepID=A0ABU1AZR3_9BACT|nr:hypothetical protein [Coraliomargarita sp. SDUM461003]MDQ8209620.1 hypothetical protein [Coraliomargarita sp. SDUM461003]